MLRPYLGFIKKTRLYLMGELLLDFLVPYSLKAVIKTGNHESFLKSET